MPFGSLDRESMRFYSEAMERVYETATEIMPIPSDFDRQEQVDEDDNGFYISRTR